MLLRSQLMIVIICFTLFELRLSRRHIKSSDGPQDASRLCDKHEIYCANLPNHQLCATNGASTVHRNTGWDPYVAKTRERNLKQSWKQSAVALGVALGVSHYVLCFDWQMCVSQQAVSR